ncbi:MAG TPA: TonB-dependent receptor [Candidatus Didemnitutus sp.]|nr:TonB-dependent receptor [Candidatus Didemnitutus sp.]
MASALIAGASLAVAGVAQTTTASSSGTDSDTAVKLDKYEVTGSYIPAAADEARVMPIQVIDAMTIAQSGVNTNILDVLRKQVPQIAGGNNIGIENANISGGSTNGGSQVALRNIDTLVLINGKRLAPNAVAAGGESGSGGEYVDLNVVPISAVERIEVLTDGASAVYGTDAVSGVINVILKKNYEGAEFGFHFTEAPNDTGGYWRSRSAYTMVGASNAKTNVTVAAEWTKTDPIWERDVAYDNQYFGTASYPGVINDPSGNFYRLKDGLNAPPTTPTPVATLIANGTYYAPDDVTAGFNLSGRPTISAATDKRIVVVNGTHKLSDMLSVNVDMMYSDTESNYQLNPQPVSASSTTLIAHGVSAITDPGWTIRNRFLGGPNRIYDNTTNFYRGTIELEGHVNDYLNFNVYANYSLSHQVALGENQILNSALLNGIYNGQINLFAISQDPTKLAQANIFGTSIAIYKSQFFTYDAIAKGKIWDLPGGTLGYAAGVEYRKEALNATADYNSTIPPGGTSSLWNNGTSLSPFNNSRNVKAEFAEVKVPIFGPSQNITGLHALTLDGAVRHEAYSDGNATTVPRYQLNYRPINDELALTATYAQSFTAPTLYDLYGPSSSGFTTSLGGLKAYNSSGQLTGSNFPNLQGFQLNGFNPALKPSKAKSYTFGVRYSPNYAKGLEVRVDYYQIKQSDLIGSPGGTTTMVQSVEQYGAASPFAPFVTLGNFAGQGGTQVTSPGQLSSNITNVYVLQSLVNIANQKQHGFDVDVRYVFPWQQYGRFTVESKANFLQQFFLQTGPTDPGFDYSGTDLYGTLAKFSAYTTLDWQYQNYNATLGFTHKNAVDDGYGDQISAYNTFDIRGECDLGQLSPKLKGVSVAIGCNNFTNRQPPLDRVNYASPPFDASAYSFFGREYYFDVKVKF